MSAYQHPMRKLGILTYHCPEAPEGRAWLAFFSDHKNYPIYFAGKTFENAYQAALNFQNEQIAKHEDAYIARKKMQEKARAKRAAA